jgi:hypothetical protein
MKVLQHFHFYCLYSSLSGEIGQIKLGALFKSWFNYLFVQQTNEMR